MNKEILAGDRLTLKDYLEASHLHERTSSGFLSKVVWGIIFIPLTIVSFYRINHPNFLVWGELSANYIDLSPEELQDLKFAEFLNSTILFLASVLFVGQAFPKISPLNRWFNARDYHQNFIKQESRQISISSTVLMIVTENYREVRLWESFNRVVENKKMFLLYHSRNSEYAIVPKRIFTSEAELAYFRSLLDSSLTEP